MGETMRMTAGQDAPQAPPARTAPRDVDRVIGAVLRRHRTGAALTQKAVAEAIGVSFQQLQKYEAGVNRLAVARLLDLCTVLGLRPQDIVSEIVAATASTERQDSPPDRARVGAGVRVLSGRVTT